MGLIQMLKGNPVIAAVREPESIDYAVSRNIGAIFLLCGEICDLKKVVGKCKAAGKPVFIHLELVSGLSGDHAGMRYLTREVGPDGVITTKTQQIALAAKEGLVTIQRLFMLDSLAVKTGIASARSARPGAVEVLPAVVPRAISTVVSKVDCPVIAGGLIESLADIKSALAAGAVAVSLSKHELWDASILQYRRRCNQL
ncbi:MAG: glycerol-3-phosphate responsive antiterminator [Firmicutes bacterium]|nr:glycerol-3-phosphate responsive antiterminator [Bacillota bacterium]